MKKGLVIIVIFLISIVGASAQMRENERDRKFERIHAAKMAYLVDRLQLTERQSAQFTPVYDEMMAEVRAVRKDFNDKHSGDHEYPADDSVSRQYIDDDLDYQEKILGIRRKYKERFLKYINATQLAKLPEAERDFNRMIYNMRKRQPQSERRGGWFRSSSSLGY